MKVHVQILRRIIHVATGKPAVLVPGRWHDGGDDDPSSGVYVRENSGPCVHVETHDGKRVATFRMTDAEYRENGNDLMVIAKNSDVEV